MAGPSVARRLRVAASITLVSAFAFVIPAAARADDAALTRARVAELARAAPGARVASSEVAVARAAVTAAGALSLENPVLSAMGGVRFNPGGDKPLAAVTTLSWPVELGGQRGGRIEAAKADERAAAISAEDTQRRLVLAALLQHALVLRDARQMTLATERRALSQRLAAASEQRRKAGSVPELDVALATLQERRDAASETTAKGALEADKLVLLSLLGISAQSPAVVGALVPTGDPPPLAVLLRELAQQTDVRATAATLDAAKARLSRERAAKWPTVSVLAQYERDDRANIGLLGLAIPIPVLNANRANVATAEAEVDAAAARLTASRAGAEGKLKELYARYQSTRATLEVLAPVAAIAKQAVDLSTRAYELGESDLASALLARREALDTLVTLLDAEHAHATAKIELFIAAGRIPQ
jgi:cobalt-zinc-cadmium efflux system outer membrane protein